MKTKLILALLAGAAVLPATLAAQTAPPAAKPAAVDPADANGKDAVDPLPRTVEGQPVDARRPEKAGDMPVFPEQTRAPYHKTAPYQVTTITNKLHLPWCIAFLPDGKFLITEKEKPGAIRIVDKDGAISTPLKGLEPLMPADRLGFMDVALEPHFAKNHRVYFVFYENLKTGKGNDIVAHAVLDEASLSLHDVTVIWRAVPAFPVKNFSSKQGGRILFDRDGNLIFPTGDRDAGPPWHVAQELDNDLGKVIRITPEGLPAPGNPFIGKQGALPEIWAYGLRSPQGWARDPRTGKIWETEHGPRGGDEVNIIEKGKNYGWPVVTHGIDYPGTPIGDGKSTGPGLQEPTYYWSPSIAPSGLVFYTGNLFPEWKNSLLAGSLRGKRISRLEIRNDKVVGEESLLRELNTRLRDVRVGPDGAVYVLTEQNSLLKLTPKPK